MGGVGSHAAHMLARAGVRKMRLIDFDMLTLSSLNRHAVGIRADVGKPKAIVLAERLKHIMGDYFLEIEPLVVMFTKENALELLKNADYVLDCIDDMTTKIELLETCSQLNLKLISSSGAGGKSDPTRIRIGPLQEVTYDPLASRMRARISREKKRIDMSQIETVFTTEDSKIKLLSLNESQLENPEDFGTVPNFRLRIMPVLGTSPALFGISMAARVLTQLSGTYSFSPIQVEQVSNNVILQTLQKLRSREKLLFPDKTIDFISETEIAHVIVFWKKTCPFTKAKIGGNSKLELCRFYYNKELDLSNVFLAKSELVDFVYNQMMEKKFFFNEQVLFEYKKNVVISEKEVEYVKQQIEMQII